MRRELLVATVVLLAGCSADQGDSKAGAGPAEPLQWVGGAGWMPDVRLSDPARMFAGPQQVLYETSVAIDPTDPDNVLAFAIDLSTQNLGAGMYSTNRYYRSTDGGRSWSDEGPMRYADDGRVWGGGDPVVAFAQDGTAYFASLAGDPDGGQDGIWVHRSTDGGATWDLPVLAVASQRQGEGTCTGTDKEWLEVDRWTGALYVAFTLFTYDCQGPPVDPVGASAVTRMREIGIHFTRSDDGGRTWTAPALVYDGYGLGAIPRAAPDGTLHVAFWSTSIATTTPCPSLTGLLVTLAEQGPFHTLTVGRSADGGKSWTLQTLDTCIFDLAEATKGGRVVGGNFLGSLSVDPADGQVVLAYPFYVPAMDRFEVRVITSNDGRDWSSPSVVRNGMGDARMPTVLARDRVLHLTYLASQADNSGGITYVRSSDGGRSWSEPFALNSKPFRLGDDPEVGDYTGLDLVGDRLVATWTDARNGNPTEIWGRAAVLQASSA